MEPTWKTRTSSVTVVWDVIAAAVIDYITKNKKAGGSVSGGAIHSLSSNRTSIDDMISGRYNYGKSEISANVRYIQRKGDWTREY